MIDRNELGYFELRCDACGDEADSDFDTFAEAIEYKRGTARGEGWRSVKDCNGDWWDLCTSCATPENIRNIKVKGAV